MTCNTAVLVITKISSAIYDEDSSAGNDSPVTIMVATQVDSLCSSSSSYDDRYTDGANDNVMPSSTDDEATSVPVPVPAAVTIMTTVFHESLTAIHDEMPFAVTDGISSAAVVDGAQYDYYYGDTAVSIASPSIVAVSIASLSYGIGSSFSAIHDRLFSAVADAVTRTTTSYALRSYDIDSSSSAIYDGDSSAVNDPPTVVMVEPYDMSYESPSAAIMKTTAPNTSHSMQRDTSVLYDRNLTTITIMNTTVKMMTNDYLAVIEAESSADITNAITLYASPQIISFLSTLLSIHRTIHLIFLLHYYF